MATQEKKEILPQKEAEVPAIEIVQPAIEKLIYVIRDKQVMVDSDLAMLYQVETGALNRAVKRNIKRFPEDFRFQLTVKEYERGCRTKQLVRWPLSSSNKPNAGLNKARQKV